jgi:enhancing lycopene biosynthesis protein 2
MSKKIAVVLSGSGFKDGSEITEAVSTLIHLSALRTQFTVFAPNLDFLATDHLSGAQLPPRNALSESCRIARGQAMDLKELNVDDFDGLVFPGGYGAAKNLCTFGTEGSNGKVLPLVQKAIRAFYESSKPICAICIAPALIALALKDKNIVLTIGDDPKTASEIEKTGNSHQNCPVNDYVSDRENKIITTPAYMFDAKPHEIFDGIGGAIRELVEMS